MAYNFLACDRGQSFLMPPDPREWLPVGHLAWFVLGAVEQVDLCEFYASYRVDGWGRAAFEPEMMVALLLYSYARGERSSRAIERKCVEDVAYRVIAAQQAPDHSRIARFRVRHEESLAALFSDVLLLCKQAGLVKVGVIAIDGTKVHANASHHSNLDYEQLAREIIKEAGEIDAAEDELYVDARGDELPEHLQTAEGRRGALAEAKRKLERNRAESGSAQSEAAGEAVPSVGIDPNEDGLHEERESLDRESQPEHAPECGREVWPQQPHLKAEDRASDHANRKKRQHDSAPAPGHCPIERVAGSHPEPLHEQNHRGERDPEADKWDVDGERQSLHLPSLEQILLIHRGKGRTEHTHRLRSRTRGLSVHTPVS
jgi:transposase